MTYTKIKFILRTTQNLSYVVPVKSKVEISQTCVAFSEYIYELYLRSIKQIFVTQFTTISVFYRVFFVKAMYFLTSVHQLEPAKQFGLKILIFDTIDSRLAQKLEVSRRFLTLTLCQCFEFVRMYSSKKQY